MNQFSASFPPHLVKDIKDLKVFISRGNAGFTPAYSPVTIKKNTFPLTVIFNLAYPRRAGRGQVPPAALYQA